MEVREVAVQTPFLVEWGDYAGLSAVHAFWGCRSGVWEVLQAGGCTGLEVVAGCMVEVGEGVR